MKRPKPKRRPLLVTWEFEWCRMIFDLDRMTVVIIPEPFGFLDSEPLLCTVKELEAALLKRRAERDG